MIQKRINRRFASANHAVVHADTTVACELLSPGSHGLSETDVRAAIDILIDAGCTRPAQTINGPLDRPTFRWDAVGKLTYSWEWPAEGWLAASRILLRALEALKGHGLTLAGLQPWDVFMAGVHPILVNPGLLARWSLAREAAALEQVERYFLRPVACAMQGHACIARRLLKGSGMGLSAEDEAIVLGLGSRGVTGGVTGEATCGVTRDTLECAASWLADLRLPDHEDFWKRYTERARSDEAAAKAAILGTILDRVKPNSVLDIGCNTGRFSFLASRHAPCVVGIDSDEACLNALFRRAASSSSTSSTATMGSTGSTGSVCGVVMDMGDPSVSRGWGEGWCLPAERRLASDFVMMLAFLHHIMFGMQLPSADVRHLLCSLSERWLVIEFVPPQDDEAGWRPEYSIDWLLGLLRDRFVKRECWEYGSRGRTLLLLERVSP